MSGTAEAQYSPGFFEHTEDAQRANERTELFLDPGRGYQKGPRGVRKVPPVLLWNGKYPSQYNGNKYLQETSSSTAQHQQ